MPTSTATDKEAREYLRGLANLSGYSLFVLALLLGTAMIVTEPERFPGSVWTYVKELSHPGLVWGIFPVVAGVLGLVGMVTKRYIFSLVSTFTCSLWSFVMGCFLAAALTFGGANIWWPLIMMFLSISYTLLGLSFTERYL